MKSKIIFLVLLLLRSKLVFTQNLPTYLPANGLVGWWPLSGNAIDSSGNTNNGSTYNVSFGNDRFGTPNKAAYFNGSSSYIEVPNSSSLSLSSAYSISLWFKAAQWSFLSPIDEHALVSKIVDGNWYGGYEIRQGGTAGGVHHTGNINGNFYIGAIGADTGIWYNVITTFNGNTVKFYLNGILRDSIYSPGNIQTSTTPLRFGRRGGAGYYNCWYNGLIDDVAIWNRALSSQEIQSLNSGSTLPVSFNLFKVNEVGNKPRLDWTTASEYNNRGFYVERSLDSEHWNNIAFIQGKGNSNTTSNYSFIDNTIQIEEAKTIYYRLLQIDIDGKKEYSKIVSFIPNPSQTVSVSPNPFKDVISLEGDFASNELLSFCISEMAGHENFCHNINISHPTKRIDIPGLSELPPGVYILSIKTSSSSFVHKIIKL